jgi:hypothetical protein
MRRVVGVLTVVFWASAALMVVLVVLSWVAPGLRDEQAFLSLSDVSVGLAMVCSGLLLWRELRANRQELRAVRRERRDIRVEEAGEEWTPKAWLYATAFGLSFFVSWYLLLPALFFSRAETPSFGGEAMAGTGTRHTGQKRVYSPKCVEQEFSEVRVQPGSGRCRCAASLGQVK